MLSELTRLDKEVLACLPTTRPGAYPADIGEDVFTNPIGKPLGVPVKGREMDARRSILKLRRLLARAVGERPLDTIACTHTKDGLAYSLSRKAHAYVAKNTKSIWKST